MISIPPGFRRLGEDEIIQITDYYPYVDGTPVQYTAAHVNWVGKREGDTIDHNRFPSLRRIDSIGSDIVLHEDFGD